ncbi:MAG TPA: TolC family protein [Bryobacteraceae bacterium]|nr:TolC family protein [Bryobacteraceae bacterium]
MASAPVSSGQAPQQDNNAPRLVWPRGFTHVRPLNFENSTRIHDLIRSGNLYLSLSDAIALGIENNLDIELQRFSIPLADTDVLRAQGGGTLRGVPFILAETPAGVGGPLSPLVTNPASASTVTPGTAVSTNPLELGVLGEVQTDLSVQGTIPQSNGTPVPIFDPALVAQLNWTHQTTPQTNTITSGTNSLISKIATANVGIAQGFSSGTQVSLAFDNNHQSVNSLRNNYSPFTGSSLGLTVTQPLARGFGPGLNRRFIRIANNNQKITSLLFEQQLIATVYGVTRLYTDLVALYEDVKNKEESLALAQKLFIDTQAQVEEGTLARVEMTRANASVFSSRQELINSRGLLEEQEAILKNVLTKTGNQDPQVQSARIIPTDPLTIPEKEEIRPIQDLLSEAMAQRPDLRQANLQIENSEIGLKGSRNAVLPEVDLVGVAQNNGLAGTLNPLAPNPDASLAGGYGTVLDQIFRRKFPTYGIGVQVTLPVRNRVAEADLARDEIQLRQSQVRMRQLQNQARLEVEDSLIAMRRARSSYEAAVQARLLQEESLDAEQQKFAVGASTSFFVIQYESLLAQAKSTEVAAKGAYVKARAALQRATGAILSDNNVTVESAYQNHK